jgi:predicted deacylase
MNQSATQPPLPPFEVRLTAPDLRPWLTGDTGIEGFLTREARLAGPHVAVLALMHGNEIGGAIALDQLLRAGIRPPRGRLTFGFVNLEAFARFDPRQPTASRFVDEDMNRVWEPGVLDGPRQSSELARARAIRPLIDTVDVLLDLHSMLWPSDPLILCGAAPQGRALARGIGVPPLVVADRGHVGGRRIIDYPRFAEDGRAANLVEAGQHWQPDTVDMSLACIAGMLHHLGMADDATLPHRPSHGAQRFATVTEVVTAATSSFSFVQKFRGGDVVPQRHTLIALDGEREIRTPHADCLLVMPSLRPSRGHTAVRLARFDEM